MKPINNWDAIEEMGTSEFRKLPAGGYVVKILSVEDKKDKSYLELVYDIAEGEYKDYYSDDWGKDHPYAHQFRRSYTEKAQGFFKGFIKNVEASNKGYTWNWDEKTLVGKVVGIVLGEEEYNKTNGTVGTRLYDKSIKSAEDIRKGNFVVPDLKVLENKVEPETPEGFTEADIPF